MPLSQSQFFRQQSSIYSQKARSLIPALAARASSAEEKRRIPQETLEDFRTHGFDRLLVPHAFGGEPASLTDVADVVIELAAGCASSAWVLSLYALHNWLVSLFPERAQVELFSSQRHCQVTSPAGNGTAEAVEGGFRLSGHWTWASGIHHCDWILVNADVSKEATRVGLCCLIPAHEAVLIDSWYASGMCATGSDDVVVRNVFVPTYRTLDAVAMLEGQTPGATLHNVDLYRIPLVTLHCLIAACTAIGIAVAAVNHYEAFLRRSSTSFMDEAEAAAARMRLGRALIRVNAAWVLHRYALKSVQVADGSHNSLDRRALARMVVSHVVGECRSVVRDILDASGASAHRLNSPLERMERDIVVLSGHVLFNTDMTAELYGRVAIGLPPQVPLV